jgi:UDP-N-acetylglucosamine acyltransferase
MITSIGNENLLMAYVHVAHDVIIADHTILANCVTFAGHVRVDEYANIGGHCGIHQFCRIGRHAMVGSYSVINQDVLPFSTIATTREVKVYGANRVGMERRGYSTDAIEPLQNAFRILTRAGLNTTQAVARIQEEVASTPEVCEVLEFISNSRQGFVK